MSNKVYLEFPEKICKKRIKSTLEELKSLERMYYAELDFTPSLSYLPLELNRRRLKSVDFKRDCLSIYLSNLNFIHGRLSKFLEKKKRETEIDLNIFRLLKDDSECAQKYINEVNQKILSDCYSFDYTAIDEISGEVIFNQIIYLAENVLINQLKSIAVNSIEDLTDLETVIRETGGEI